MSVYEIDGRCKLIWSRDGTRCGVSVPGTHDQLGIVDDNYPYGWQIVAIRSGVKVTIWDEWHENVVHPASGRVEDEVPLMMQSVHNAIATAQELYAAATAAGIAFEIEDASLLREALSRVAFVVSGPVGVSCRPFSPPQPKRRKRTQKILDGGEDMTV